MMFLVFTQIEIQSFCGSSQHISLHLQQQKKRPQVTSPVLKGEQGGRVRARGGGRGGRGGMPATNSNEILSA